MAVISPSWPNALSEEAFHGVAGSIVRKLEPHTEADPAALLVQLLVAFGNVINRGPHFMAEMDRHAFNLFTVLVGETSKARKGSSWTHISRLIGMIDTLWAEYCIQTGLSSGEGLIHAVRDSCEGDERHPGDSGALDRRLLVVESEFASPLRMIARDGNTLSPVVRQAWDGGKLQVLTKQSPERATDPHISIIGHVTREELRRELTRTDAGSGFGNRFLWVCVRRSKVLPDGGRLPDPDFELLTNQVKDCVEFAQSLGEHQFTRDPDAKAVWHQIYAELSEGKPGLFGAVTSRGEAQVMRLACLYALLDKSKEVAPAHLQAALAIWKYCEASARYVFGEALGHPIADEILTQLCRAPQGMTKTEIHAVLGRNHSKFELDTALALLASCHFAAMSTQQTAGRPSERWHAVTPVIR